MFKKQRWEIIKYTFHIISIKGNWICAAWMSGGGILELEKTGLESLSLRTTLGEGLGRREASWHEFRPGNRPQPQSLVRSEKLQCRIFTCRWQQCTKLCPDCRKPRKKKKGHAGHTPAQSVALLRSITCCADKHQRRRNATVVGEEGRQGRRLFLLELRVLFLLLLPFSWTSQCSMISC